jgi:hypothetical protein
MLRVDVFIFLIVNDNGDYLFLRNVDRLSRDIPEDRTLHDHSCENLKTYM